MILLGYIFVLLLRAFGPFCVLKTVFKVFSLTASNQGRWSFALVAFDVGRAADVELELDIRCVKRIAAGILAGRSAAFIRGIQPTDDHVLVQVVIWGRKAQIERGNRCITTRVCRQHPGNPDTDVGHPR